MKVEPSYIILYKYKNDYKSLSKLTSIEINLCRTFLSYILTLNILHVHVYRARYSAFFNLYDLKLNSSGY